MSSLIVSGITGKMIGELLGTVIKAAETAIRCKQHCRCLQTLLKSVEHIVNEAIKCSSASPSPGPIHNWLLTLRETLEDAEEAVKDCSHKPLLNPWSRYQMATRIVEITGRLGNLFQQATLVTLGVTLSLGQELEATKKEMQREMQEGLHRLELSIATQNSFSLRFTAERAFYLIKTQVDKLSTYVRNLGTGSQGASSSSTMLEDDVEKLAQIQPVPQLVFGMERLTTRLQELVLPTNDTEKRCKCIGVWGPGGAGKTLLVQRVYNSAEVRSSFKGDSMYWLTVGQNPTIRALYITLSKHFNLQFENNNSQEELKITLYNKLLRKKVFLVLDDVWDEDALEWLQLAKGAGSVTLVTSRNRPVLQKLSETEVIVSLLCEQDSWSLFCVHAFGGDEKILPELEGLARLVADECKGLPLALKVIGGAMVGKLTSHEWRIELAKLKNSQMLNNYVEKEIFNRLELSFNDLDNLDPRSKECFLYFAAFPEDHVVYKDDLFDLWMGECMVGDHGDDPEDDAFYLLGLLIGRSLIELHTSNFFGDGKKYFKIHDILRDLALHILGRNRVEHERYSLFWAGKNLKQFPSEWTTESRGCSLAAHRLSLMDNQVTQLPLKLHAPYLRTLLLCQNPLKFLPHGLLEGLGKLMVLDLRGCRLKSLPNSIGNLKLLVYLNLSDSSIHKLPNSIKNLRRLERMYLSECSDLKCLPAGIIELSSLKSLDLKNCDNLWEESTSLISRSLDKCLIRKASLEDICKLSSLTHLNITASRSRQLPVALSLLVNLKMLHVDGFNQSVRLPNEMQSLVELQDMELHGCSKLVKLPEWITSFKHLTRLSVKFCWSLSHLPALDALPMLLELDLAYCISLTELPTSFGRAGAFPVLETFGLNGCEQLVAFPTLQPGAIPKLLKLNLTNCSSLKELTHFVEMLTSLESLHLGGTRIENLCEINFGGFPNLQQLLL